MDEERIHSCTCGSEADGEMKPGAQRVVKCSHLPQPHGIISLPVISILSALNQAFVHELKLTV
ncbi:hypothetical protein [Mucilaginibacter sp.]|uniref:hypothetical protein n=1 Tax=Mucilaginibacter sp. TaxID=1882438 RepID=UPI0025E8255E|nr:hypothetical protein [Mucilaginibacter sp.]